MSQSKAICKVMPNYWSEDQARQIAAECERLTGAAFRVHKCRHCGLHHVTVKQQSKETKNE